MNNNNDFEFDDVQGLVRCSYWNLADTCFLLLTIKDPVAAKEWLSTAPVSAAVQKDPPTALQIAFTSSGLRALGLDAIIDRDASLNRFSDEFLDGMTGDKSRSRRLGDIGANDPEKWDWGGDDKNMPHALLLLYANPKFSTIDGWRKKVEGKLFAKAFKAAILPTLDIGNREPFGFVDGISQPKIDWKREQSTDPHKRFGYSNLVAVGEVLLGYLNEYRQYTARPLIDPKQDQLAAALLPDAEDQPGLKDFGRNGAYLVLRQLDQDVSRFWRFVDKAAGSDPKQREQLAAAMIGRKRDGTPLAPIATDAIPGIDAEKEAENHFNYKADPLGQQCPFGSHVRRTNPRTGDMPGTVSGWWSWLIKTLGFGLSRMEEDLIASTRFHRMLRRGRSYGPRLMPEDAIKADAPEAERGLQFICLVANIQRQFEFVQNAWVVSSKFAGLQGERDPILGHRQALLNDDATDRFHQPDPAGPMHKTYGLPQFITVKGGAYFFMPGLRALKYIAAVPSTAKPATGRDN